ncbi:DUF255 domain-containing protein [Haloparvum sedimenti]|uniref:DUF255 domain-containing protein n=1 Tax=Haloparvum sedimenti TaxID=1678448 RepID=UPI00071E6CA9|nr:DUF255 domain-containing protein [Haloparvum sedimenti]
MTETRVEWREWGPEAFAAAAETDRPVLLSLTATWCADCHEMDAKTYAEPRIAANVNDGFVPVRVDVDRNPRVRERYNMGGFPSTVFLAPDGTLLTGAGYLDPEGMRQVLDSVREMYAEKGADAGRVPRALAGDLPPTDQVTEAIEEHLVGQLDVKFDEEHAGWGDDAKFPLPRTVEFALKRDRDRALRTLDAVRNHLTDEVAGGFFRYAGGRDWTDVHYEKPLDTNAAVLRAFANAYLYTGEEAYRQPAAGAVSFLTDDLWTGVGVGGSLGPGTGRAYYARSAGDRADLDAPREDLTVYAGGNALAADAMLAFHAYTDDERAGEYAERILGVLRRDLIDAETGAVTRFRAGDAVGETDLLEDAARVVAALVRAESVLGEGADLARTVADRAIERLHDGGSFVDGPREGEALLDRPFRPVDGNVEMAETLLDLSLVTGEERYEAVARETAAAFAGASERFGVQVAGYGSLVGRLTRGSTLVAVGTEPGSDLHRAALRVADHEKVVVPNAHRGAGPLDVEEGAAVVRVGDRTADPATTPDELMARVADAVA